MICKSRQTSNPQAILIEAKRSEHAPSPLIKIKKMFLRAWRYLLLGLTVASIGVLLIPTVILVAIIAGLWALLNRILSSLDEKQKDFDFSQEIRHRKGGADQGL